ncbi:hypothetical protein KIW84_062105 [Lathyrus oleraceus]|uniref:Uncharacterized protein n=1 Tax=Pisum sativum TaxID=3888 RepID=A0A9D4W6S5_PEA|nr:hypothetical protein KIW84_062105 [Pisum sativum]
MSWDKLARAKGEGGLGFRGIRDFNTSLLGKNYCRLLIGENSFIGKVFKGRLTQAFMYLEEFVSFGYIIKNPALGTVLAASREETILVAPEVAKILTIRWCRYEPGKDNNPVGFLYCC